MSSHYYNSNRYARGIELLIATNLVENQQVPSFIVLQLSLLHFLLIGQVPYFLSLSYSMYFSLSRSNST